MVDREMAEWVHGQKTISITMAIIQAVITRKTITFFILLDRDKNSAWNISFASHGRYFWHFFPNQTNIDIYHYDHLHKCDTRPSLNLGCGKHTKTA